jgi:hypothetical protein
MARSIETFEQARKLDTAEQRAWAAGARGRPQQRVWAMWALALRHQGVPEMNQARRSSRIPACADPRRHARQPRRD